MPTKSEVSCSQHGPSGTYADGPTACAPHPRVIRNIKKQISNAKILSVADARIAALSGMLGTPQETRTGFNDGVIYPPKAQSAGLALSGTRGKPRVSRALALPTGMQTLNCLVLLVDFSDNKGTKTPSVLLTPVAVTKDNINDTVIKDGFLKPSEICVGKYASLCQKAGISG